MRPEEAALLTRAKDRSELAKLYSPAHWDYTLRNPGRAYTATCPALARLDAMYGRGAADEWMDIQVTALFTDGASSSKGMSDVIGRFASGFAAEAGGLKISELMLFFARYKNGRYDNSYSQFDPRRIGHAFFKEFLPQRACELDAIEREKAAEEAVKRRGLPEGYTVPEGYNPYTWYRERVRRGEIKSYGNLTG